MLAISLKLRRLILDAVWHRANDDLGGLRDTLLAITREAPHAFFLACASWAEMVHSATMERVALEAPPGSQPVGVGFRIENRDTGESVNPDELPADMQARVWALRFVAAVGNRDMDATLALFRQSEEHDEGIGLGPFEVLDMATEAATGSPSWETERLSSDDMAWRW